VMACSKLISVMIGSLSVALLMMVAANNMVLIIMLCFDVM